MPRRSSARTTTSSAPLPASSPARTPASHSLPENLTQLRTQWKWAAFSQFFFTFNHLFSMNDVSLADIEDDLTRGSCIVLPRVMQRLLYTLSYDRKISLNNWQTALRKQYYKRDPVANPIGPNPYLESRERQPSPAAFEDATPDPEAGEPAAGPSSALPRDETHAAETTSTAEGDELGVTSQDKSRSVQPSEPESASGSAVLDAAAEREESKDWLDLPMLAKLDSMHLLTEWQFHNPTRIRTLMRNDDEIASWRIEPIGYDSKKNAYWLIGADRLWLQRALPKPPKTSLKRKRADPQRSTQASSNSKSKRLSTTKRPRLRETPVTGSASKSKAGAPTAQAAPIRGGRAAKAQANIKLDMQAKELAELNRQAAALSRNPYSRSVTSATRSSTRHKSEQPGSAGRPMTQKPVGTRISARLRGSLEGEWQAIPEEWLSAGNDANGAQSAPVKISNGEKSHALKTGLESDDDSISDLTELSEESESDDSGRRSLGVAGGQDTDIDEAGDEERHRIEPKSEPAPDPTTGQGSDDPSDESRTIQEGFIEWETLCVTLSEWEHIAERFVRATHYSEKALYKVLAYNIVPIVTEELREIDRKRRLDEALVHRKRSSRIAIRQSEKEEAQAVARKHAEEEEKMSRAKRLEARLQKEEAERIRRETSREQRRKEREEKEAKEKMVHSLENNSDIQVDVLGDGSITNSRQKTPRPNGISTPATGTGSGPRTPIGDDWELDCEICHRHGINPDDTTPMMSCGICSKWQHIACHDWAAQQAGRQKRDWTVAEFFCHRCSRNRSQSNGDPSTMGRSMNPYLMHSPHDYANPVNGSGQSMSSVPGSYPPQAQPQPQTQPYRARQPTIAFSHYQPQQRGFAPSSGSQLQQQPYNASGTLQPYGHHAVPSGQFPQYPTPAINGGGGLSVHTFQRNASPHRQARWNVTTPVHPPGYVPYGANVVDHSNATHHGHDQHPPVAAHPQFRHYSTS